MELGDVDLVFAFHRFGDEIHDRGEGEEDGDPDEQGQKGADVRSRNDKGRDEDVEKGEFEEYDPTEFHELVVAEAGDGPAYPDEEDDEANCFGEEDAEVNKAREPLPSALASLKKRGIEAEAKGPAAEENGHDDRGAHDHGGVFSHEEERKFHGGVLGVIAAHQFGFTLGKIEGHAVGFREDRGGEDDEGDSQREQEEPLWSAVGPVITAEN